MFGKVIKKLLDKVISFFIFILILNIANKSFKFNNIYQLENRKHVFLLFKFQLIKLQVTLHGRQCFIKSAARVQNISVMHVYVSNAVFQSLKQCYVNKTINVTFFTFVTHLQNRKLRATVFIPSRCLDVLLNFSLYLDFSIQIFL